MRSIKNMSFSQSKGLTEGPKDIMFADNIFKFIDEYDRYIAKLKNPQQLDVNQIDARDWKHHKSCL